MNKPLYSATFLYMPFALRHHPDRRYHGEDFGSQVVRFLNGPPAKSDRTHFNAAKKRILSLLDMLRPVVFGEKCYFYGDPRLPDLFRLNKLLRRYTSCSIVLPSPIYKLPPPGTSEREAFDRLTKPVALRFFKGADPFEPTFDECVAADALVRLAELHSLDSLKTCKQCGLWFFAKFSHQEFCKPKCRIKHNASSETWKEYKRNKAREYYHLHKSGKVREH